MPVPERTVLPQQENHSQLPAGNRSFSTIHGEISRRRSRLCRAGQLLHAARCLQPVARERLRFQGPRRGVARALQLDDNLPEAHTALALVVQNYDWNWQLAEKEFRRAIELGPNYATAHHWYAEHLTWRGRFDEALREIEQARKLDPLSLIIAAGRGAILYYSRQYDRAIQQLQSVLALEPNFPRAHLIASVYAEKRMLREALADIEKQRPKIEPAWYWSTLAYVYGRCGWTAEARQALYELNKIGGNTRLDPAVFLFAYAGTGDKEQLLATLDAAYAQHSSAIATLKVAPVYDSIRNEPRFQDLLRRLGL